MWFWCFVVYMFELLDILFIGNNWIVEVLYVDNVI